MELITQIQKLTEIIYAKDISDILIIALCIYLVLIFIKQTRSFFMMGAFGFLFGLNYVAEKFDLTLTRQLFEPLLTLFIAIFVIVFQPEIRKFFKWLSSGRAGGLHPSQSVPRNNIQTIVRAVFEMAKNKVGAIIVFPAEYPLDDLLDGGFPLNGKISAALIQSIFDSSSPGHDGAILIEGSEIKMFGLHLPLAREFTDYRRVGTRHRAAAGITERTDAMAIVVSEERGEVSVSSKGVLTKVGTPEELANILADFTGEEKETKKGAQGMMGNIVFRNWGFKLAAIGLSASVWFFSVYNAGIVKADYLIPIEYRGIASDLVIKNSSPNEISVTVVGNNKDMASLKKEDINIVVDGSKFKNGNNAFTIEKNNIQVPAYLELNTFTPKNVQVRIEAKK